MRLRSILKLFRNVETVKLNKGDILISEGSTDKYIYFVRRGLMRSFFINDKAEEITFQLYPEYQIVMNIQAFLFDEPSKFTFQAIESTKLYRIDYSLLVDISSNNQDLLAMNRRFFGRRIMSQIYGRVESFVLLSPEERYKKYLKDYPDIINRAPDKYIANVLGITPVSLSRIRSRMAGKGKMV